jgi:quinoprotein glucose dehydrogenase
MSTNTWRLAASASVLAALLVWTTRPTSGQGPLFTTQNGEWPTYGGDLRSTRYSPLDQINAETFNKIEVAWRFKTDVQPTVNAPDGQGCPLHRRGNPARGRGPGRCDG